ncbi:kinesin-like protein KIN-4C isoform X2 [Humulus lupulus]|uniref:kinesin-like protein KIN-4C isoform X2 n=1 Tax=Humulus lupulus TaxID=3486 RepID=UPI002B4167C6|nr:kinesin-like protein KIN-4C isoform X2 [Humulus lupulus]
MMKKIKRCGSKQPVNAQDNHQDCQIRVRELEQQNNSHQKEIEELKYKLANVPSNSTDSAMKVKEDYLQKLTTLQDQVADLKNKLEIKSQFSVQRSKGDEATRRLQFEIQNLKAQKVQLQCKLKVESLQFRLSKASHEKEILQLRREYRRNQFQMNKLLDSNQRLKMVVQRKAVEASMATKRLKELFESRQALSHRSRASGTRNETKTGIQRLGHESELTTLHALCAEYERQMDVMAEERAKLKEEVEELRQENLRYQLEEKEALSLEKGFDINELKEEVVSISGLFRQLRLQKAELDQDKSQVSGHSSTFVASILSTEDTTCISGSENSIPSIAARNKNESSTCCSCSKKSLCKTSKCICRSNGGSCGTSCGCIASKCSNRVALPIQLNDSPGPEIAEAKVNSLKIAETRKDATDASHGAMLLQNALEQQLTEKNDHQGSYKKPLSDIGNIRMRQGRKI